MKYYASSNNSLFNHLAFVVIALLFVFFFSVHDRKNVEEAGQIKASNIISFAAIEKIRRFTIDPEANCFRQHRSEKQEKRLHISA